MSARFALSLAYAMAFAIALAFALGACSSTSTSSNDPTLPEGPGPEAEQPADVYPAKHAPIPSLDHHGGPLLTSMSLVTITFTGDAERDALRTFGEFAVKSAWFARAVGALGVGPGSVGGVAELSDTVSSQTLDDKAIQALLQSGIDSGALPAPTTQTLYAFYFPEATSIALTPTFTSCTSFGAYHNATPVRDQGGNALFVAYAVMARCSNAGSAIGWDDLTYDASHEIAEAASDPLPDDDGAYWLSSDDAWPQPLGRNLTAGAENADLCFFAGHHRENGYALARVWDDAAAAASKNPCQPQPDGARFYGAAVRSDELVIAGKKKTGYVVARRGERTRVLAEFFSDAPLPSEAALYVGTDQRRPEPERLGEIPGGITLALSRTRAHNGNAMYVVVDVPSDPEGALVGNYRIVVRAVLSQTDYNDWPVILRVR